MLRQLLSLNIERENNNFAIFLRIRVKFIFDGMIFQGSDPTPVNFHPY